MPTIEISKKDLNKLTGIRIELDEAMPLIKAEATIDENNKDLVKIELKDVNRPDLLSVEGIAKEIRLKAGEEKSTKQYKITKKDYVINVEDKVKKIRPFIACAVAKDVEVTEEFLKQLIQLQEKLCEYFGRKRKEAALGIFDFDKINWPINYTAKNPDSFSFKALGMDKEYTLKKILSMHEKGKEYGHLLENCKEYPIIIDNKNNVLSMPPIINSDYSGKVSEKTKNLFIEVTGNSEIFVIPILNTVVLALLERGAKIEQVTIIGSGNKAHKNRVFGAQKAELSSEKRITPDIEGKVMKISAEIINSTLGLDLTNKKIIELLEKSGYASEDKGKDLIVTIPFYRQDILDVRDIIEDIAISYGYNEFEPEIPNIGTIGKISKENYAIEKISNLLSGLGSQEISNFILTNKETLFKKTNQKANENQIIEIANPMSALYSCMRNNLIPGILEFLNENKNVRYPQNLYEIGKVLNIKNGKAVENYNLAYSISSVEANFTSIKQVLDILFNILEKEYKLEPLTNSLFIDGRAAKILIKDKELFEEIGVIGEINPNVLENFNLIMPTACLEINLDKIIS